VGLRGHAQRFLVASSLRLGEQPGKVGLVVSLEAAAVVATSGEEVAAQPLAWLERGGEARVMCTWSVFETLSSCKER
jgi:hypothetical protein